MQRRKFLIGAGSLAAGSAAAMGTGAFSSVEAERQVSVTTAADANAYLSLDVDSSLANSAYAQAANGTVQVNVDSAAGVPGEGVNKDATTTILDIFEITNQGTQPVFVYVDPEDGVSPDSVTVPTPGPGVTRTFPDPLDNDETYIDPQAGPIPESEQNIDADYYSLTGVYGVNDFPTDGGPFNAAALTLGVGESFNFGLNIQHSGSATFPSDISVTLTADADLAPDGYTSPSS